MALPVKPLAKDTVDLDGDKVGIRSLSRAEAIKLATEYQHNADAAEIFMLVAGTGQSEEEVTNWRNATDAKTVGKVVDAIAALSGLTVDEKGDNELKKE